MVRKWSDLRVHCKGDERDDRTYNEECVQGSGCSQAGVRDGQAGTRINEGTSDAKHFVDVNTSKLEVDLASITRLAHEDSSTK